MCRSLFFMVARRQKKNIQKPRDAQLSVGEYQFYKLCLNQTTFFISIKYFFFFLGFPSKNHCFDILFELK